MFIIQVKAIDWFSLRRFPGRKENTSVPGRNLPSKSWMKTFLQDFTKRIKAPERRNKSPKHERFGVIDLLELLGSLERERKKKARLGLELCPSFFYNLSPAGMVASCDLC